MAHSLDVVDAVINALKNANLTSGTNKVLIASEDSSVLLAFQQSLPFLQRVYHVPSNGNNPDIVTLPVLQVCGANPSYLHASFFQHLCKYLLLLLL